MKVAKILDYSTVVITRDPGQWIEENAILVICSEEIFDPETRASLGFYPAVRVKVVEVFDQFVIAETYRMVGNLDRDPRVVVKIGDTVEQVCEEDL